MVTDSLQNLEQYRGLHKNMDTVIDFLKKCDLTALPDGKTVIDGERVLSMSWRQSFGRQKVRSMNIINVMQICRSISVEVNTGSGQTRQNLQIHFRKLRTADLQQAEADVAERWGRKLCFIPAGRISQTKLQKRITHTCEKSSC